MKYQKSPRRAIEKPCLPLMDWAEYRNPTAPESHAARRLLCRYGMRPSLAATVAAILFQGDAR